MWNDNYIDYKKRLQELETIYGEDRFTTSLKLNKNLWSEFRRRITEVERRFQLQVGASKNVALGRVLDNLVFDFLDIDAKMHGSKRDFIQTKLIPDPVDIQTRDQFMTLLMTAEQTAGISGILARPQKEDVLARLERTFADVDIDNKTTLRVKRCIAKLHQQLKVADQKHEKEELSESEIIEGQISRNQERIDRWHEMYGEVDDMPKNIQIMYSDAVENIRNLRTKSKGVRND